MDVLTAPECPVRAQFEFQPAERQPRIVALTANALVGDQEKCLAAGMDGYLTKPIAFPALTAELKRAWRERRARPAGTVELFASA